jgi:hypothetical protein
LEVIAGNQTARPSRKNQQFLFVMNAGRLAAAIFFGIVQLCGVLRADSRMTPAVQG